MPFRAPRDPPSMVGGPLDLFPWISTRPVHHDLAPGPAAICAIDAAIGTDAKILRRQSEPCPDYPRISGGPARGTPVALTNVDGRQSAATEWCVRRAEVLGLSSVPGSLRRISRFCTTSHRRSPRRWGLYRAVRLTSFVIEPHRGARPRLFWALRALGAGCIGGSPCARARHPG
jgi:hypothetical protein